MPLLPWKSVCQPAPSSEAEPGRDSVGEVTVPEVRHQTCQSCGSHQQSPRVTTAETELVGRRWVSKLTATPHPLNKPSGQPQLPHKPSSVALWPSTAFLSLSCCSWVTPKVMGRQEPRMCRPTLALWLLVQAGARSPAKGRSPPAAASGLPRSIWQSRAPWEGRETRAKGRGGGGSQTSPSAGVTGTAGS